MRLRCLYDRDDRQGEIRRYLLINIDTSELRRSQNRVAEFEELFCLISEYARVGYANYNLCSREGYAQSTWLQNYGERETASIDEVIGHYNLLYPEDRKILHAALEQFQSGAADSLSNICRVRHDDGSTRWIKTNLICRDYRPEEGIIDMLGINYDITSLKQTEQELVAAKERAEESDKLKTAFLANMSHEIRTPLNAIVGFSELLTTEQDDSTRKEYADIINRNNTLLLQIISDVLDLARIESGRTEVALTRFDVLELCRGIVESCRIERPAGVCLQLAEGLAPCPINGYRQGLAQILGNFTRNALKFTKSGAVTVGFEVQPGAGLRCYVRDTGIGIRADQAKRVFERFYKVDTFTQGTGLGLSICKSIAELMNGQVGVESVPGQGSCFWVEIPLA